MSLVLGILFTFAGWWFIPSTVRQAQSPLAPYRALTGVIWLVLSACFYIAWMGK